MKTRTILVLIALLALVGVLSFATSTAILAQTCTSSGTPSITTDKSEYGPGETVVITGTGFACGVTLTVNVTAPDGSVTSGGTTTDDSGVLTHTYQVGTENVEGQFTVEVLDTNGTVLATTVFYDSHFRFGHLTYVKTGPTSVNFTLKNAFRRNGYACRAAPLSTIVSCTGPSGRPGPGDFIREDIGGTSLSFGDGIRTARLFYTVDAIDVPGNWLQGTALNPGTTDTLIPHTYSSVGPFTAAISSCCRTFAEVNNRSRSYRVEAIFNLQDGNTANPASSLPAIKDCPVNAVCSFNIPATNVDRNTITYRFSTTAESRINFQPGPPFAPNAASISPAGVYTWDTTGASGGTGALYSTQVTIEERDLGGNLVSKSAIDFLIRLVAGSPPVFDVPPTPATATNIRRQPGQNINFPVEASDPDAGDIVTISHLGLPSGDASFTCDIPGNPTACTLDWTPRIRRCWGAQHYLQGSGPDRIERDARHQDYGIRGG